jgi:hypothetical protein
MAQPCTPQPTGFFRVLSKGRSEGQKTQELQLQNIVILAGNIGQKPEVRSTQSGMTITNFSLATSRLRLSEGRVVHDENGYRLIIVGAGTELSFRALGKL